MKILYVAGRWDPLDHNQASGTDYEFYSALLRKGADIEIAGPFNFEFSLMERILGKIYRKTFNKKLSKYPFSYFYRSGMRVNQAIAEVNPDLIVSKFSAPLVFAKIDRPLLYMCDSTVKWIRENWRTHSSLAYFSMSLWEAHVIKKCNRIITFSEANAKVLRNVYKVPPEDITVFAIPASIPAHVVPDSIDENKDFKPIKLLLVGRDYHRKGVDIAISITQLLNQRGINTELRIVGLDGDGTESVKFMGLYNKTVQSELDGYIGNYQWANFLLHPARFEAAGIVPSEAAAFGVPTLTNNAGGLGTTVKDGVSGVVFPKDSPAEDYANQIIEFIHHPESYRRLVKSTRERYDKELNWNKMDDVVYRLAEELVG